MVNTTRHWDEFIDYIFDCLEIKNTLVFPFDEVFRIKPAIKKILNDYIASMKPSSNNSLTRLDIYNNCLDDFEIFFEDLIFE